MSLENQTAVVTGAGRGIGRAIALKLAEAGKAEDDEMLKLSCHPKVGLAAEFLRWRWRSHRPGITS